MSKEKRRVPKLRFPGFTEDWEQRKLSEVTTCFDNLRVPVTASDRVPGKIPYYGANGIQDYVSGHTHSGEFVLIAEDGANDLNDYPIQYVNGAIWVNNHAHVIAGYKEKLENKFLSYSLKTVKMTTFIVGGGRSKLNLKALLEIPISMPNYDEQCVIGKFIETIDINITLHQRKLNNLKLKKKALLQKLFPKNGKRYPELRFPGFTDAWEQRKLNDFGIATGGTSIESEFVDGGTYKVINIGSYSEESVYNDQGLRVNKTDKTKSRILNKYDLTMILNDKTASGNIIGRVLLIDQDNTYVYNQRTERIEVDTKNFLPMFLYHMLNAPEQRKYIVKASQGNTQIYVNWSTISNIDYMIPQLLLEQEKIANLFSLINKDITLHQRKLDHLQLQKKALLQQMFV